MRVGKQVSTFIRHCKLNRLANLLAFFSAAAQPAADLRDQTNRIPPVETLTLQNASNVSA